VGGLESGLVPAEGHEELSRSVTGLDVAAVEPHRLLGILQRELEQLLVVWLCCRGSLVASQGTIVVDEGALDIEMIIIIIIIIATAAATTYSLLLQGHSVGRYGLLVSFGLAKKKQDVMNRALLVVMAKFH